MVGGVNDCPTRLVVPPVVIRCRQIGIPREPTSYTPKTRDSGARFAAKPGLNETLPPRMVRTGRLGQHYPTFALLATLLQSRPAVTPGTALFFRRGRRRHRSARR